MQGFCETEAAVSPSNAPPGSTSGGEASERREIMQLRRSSIIRGFLLVAAMSVVTAACGGGSGTTEQGASQAPATPQTATTAPATSSADPLQGDWRNESTCQDSLRALRRRLSDKEVLTSKYVHGWEDLLFPWGGEPTNDDPCHGATGTRAFVARFADGNLALCDAQTGGCDVHATYKLVGDHSFAVEDPEGNLCPCPATWRFEIVGDLLTIHVEPADPFTVSTWEATPWARES
jgi:hypothetical protein